MFCECIQLLNKNSLWIRFVDSISARQPLSISAKRKPHNAEKLSNGKAEKQSKVLQVSKGLFFGAKVLWSNVAIRTFESNSLWFRFVS
jgi:hypothetical protein